LADELQSYSKVYGTIVKIDLWKIDNGAWIEFVI